MGQLLPMAICWAILGYAALTGVLAALPLVEAGRAFADTWEQERRLRECAGLAAAARNLAAAAAALSVQDPQGTTLYHGAAAELATRLQGRYPQAAASDPAGGCEGPGAWRTSLHLQRHPGQPEEWPNWVFQFQFVEE